jgi:hypothetical protein
VYLGRALDDLRRGGEIIPDPLLAQLAPVGWQHINLTGDYLWDADTHLAPDARMASGSCALPLQSRLMPHNVLGVSA